MPEDKETENEWDLAPPAEHLPVAPEDQDRFRGLLTELIFSAAGAPILVGTAICIHKPRGIYSSGPVKPPPAWEIAVYQWLPLLLFFLAFVCLVWLITIPLRMAELKRGTD